MNVLVAQSGVMVGSGKSALRGRMLVTGQTTQYGGYDDDGFYEMGITKRYVVYTLGAYAGVTVITLNAKNENHSNNCVLDVNTGLMWSRTVSGPNVGPANNGLLPWTTNGAGEGIFTYVAAANAAALAGYADWRVSNVFESWSLPNAEVPSGTPDAVAFPGWPTTRIWLSTTAANVIGNAECLECSHPRILPAVKVNTYYCALVRGGI